MVHDPHTYRKPHTTPRPRTKSAENSTIGEDHSSHSTPTTEMHNSGYLVQAPFHTLTARQCKMVHGLHTPQGTPQYSLTKGRKNTMRLPRWGKSRLPLYANCRMILSRCPLKDSTDGAFTTCAGRAFHTAQIFTVIKSRNLLVRNRGTSSLYP